MIKQENNLTELVFILDRSGSMAGLESDTIGGFNANIEKQKKEDGDAFVTTYLFDHDLMMLHDRVKLTEIPAMTDRDYTVRGSTALIDAMGEAITHIQQIHKYARPEDVPSHTIFVITTDGLENASRKFDSSTVKKMVEAQKEAGWEFLFLGANIDAVETASKLGISRECAANYCSDSVGTEKMFHALGGAMSSLRKGSRLRSDCFAELEADVKKRRK